jgi:membrane-bound metal-dependent hydrolase YbcI (DUF457 family)
MSTVAYGNPHNDLMKFPEHVSFSFLLAQLGVQPHYGLAGTALMVLAGNLPDLDTLTLLGGPQIYRKYHRILGHGLPVALAAPTILALLGSHILMLGPFLPLWCWFQVALLAHLAADVCFYRWPVQVLWPLSTRGWGIGLVRWNDLVPTLVLYGGTVLALLRPDFAPAFAAASIGGFVLYLGWRAWWPWPHWGWSAWITGSWALDAAPVWRWLTGDFLRRT